MQELSKIDGNDRKIRQILSKEKYKIDVYQREFKWREEDINALIDDLTSKFFMNYKSVHQRSEVQKYPPYFLGSFIINQKDNERYIVDGQQRFTSLTLLLIYLRNLALKNNIKITNVEDLIYSESFGKKSYNIDIPDRKSIMEDIFEKDEVNERDDLLVSQRNLILRYNDIQNFFPDELKDPAVLPFFIDWLIEKVIMVEIMTYNENDAYTIFETMNDRGLRLSPTDMLKGYLLTNIDDVDQREQTNALWKKQLTSLINFDKKEEISFYKNWLRAKYAKSIREGTRGAVNRDFENIDKYHRWIRDVRKKPEINLTNNNQFYEFSYNKFKFYSNTYLSILDKMYEFSPEFEVIYYNEYHPFAFQEMILLSAIKYDEPEEIVKKKLQLISYFIEMYIIMRRINRRSLGYSSIKYTMFTSIIKKIRDKDLDDIAKILTDFVNDMEEHWEGFDDFSLRSQNKYFIKFLLSRITQYIERQVGINSNLYDYMDTDQKNPYEIEHLLPNTYDVYKDYFTDVSEYDMYRNRIGGLILLPKGFNQSFKATSYEEKVKHYNGQNLLARSLHPLCYEKNPKFINYIKNEDLDFKAHEHMYKEDIEQRTKLYKQICQKIWDISRFEEIIN
jgi:uncharacterized protein with ParB-like and HNH nuclease domain